MAAGDKKFKADGIVNFMGGMETYLDPVELATSNYFASVNCKIVPGKSGIQTRSGYREIFLDFGKKKSQIQDRDFFRASKIQGSGYYIHNGTTIVLAACSGRIYEFVKQSDKIYLARYTGYQVSKYETVINFTNIPFNSVTIDDGESFPIIAENGLYRRGGREDYPMPPGRGGVFVQNRKFVISSDRKSILFSTFNDPLSRKEAVLANILSFPSPDDTDIVALGEQKSIGRDSQGGSLVFSTQRNIYSVNVYGPLSHWGDPSIPYGKIVSDIYNVAGVSSTSMVSMNGNAYFRSKKLGLVSTQYLNYIFNNTDIVEPQSYGGHLFFNSDEPAFLNSCYSVSNGSSIYTTVSPEMEDGGFVRWNGILCCTPGQKGIIRWDSLHTGLRPWCLMNVEDPFNRDILHIFSRDYDGVNRLYVMDDDLDFDSTISDGEKRIESKLMTRFYQFENPLLLKKSATNMVSVKPNCDKLTIKAYTRLSSADEFTPSHGSILNSRYIPVDRNDVFHNKNYAQKERKINLSAATPGIQSFFSIQDLFVFTGSFQITKHIRQAEIYAPDGAVTEDEVAIQEKQLSQESREIENFYSYKIYAPKIL